MLWGFFISMVTPFNCKETLSTIIISVGALRAGVKGMGGESEAAGWQSLQEVFPILYIYLEFH